MLKITQVATSMQTVLTKLADEAGRSTGFIRRLVKLSGTTFCQTLVFGWLANPEATLEELSQTAAVLGVKITAQGLAQRLNEAGAACLNQVLQATISQVIKSEPVAMPVLERFEGVYVDDSSQLSLPDELAAVWSGCGNGTGQGEASLKLNVRFDVLNGELIGPFLTDGRTHDRKSELQEQVLPPGSLRLADLGYWQLAEMADLSQAGVFWVSRVKPLTAIFTADGQRWALEELMVAHKEASEVELSVELGVEERLSARLVARRVPPSVAQQRRRRIRAEAKRRGRTPSKSQLALADWVVFVTNAPPTLLSVADIFVVARVRWQIELLFKLWKSHNQLTHSRSGKAWFRLCEIYAKLIGVVIQHWLLLVSCWLYPDRSFFKAVQTIQKHIWYVAAVFSRFDDLVQALASIQRCLACGCRINKRQKKPHTYQLLLALDVLEAGADA